MHYCHLIFIDFCGYIPVAYTTLNKLLAFFTHKFSYWGPSVQSYRHEYCDRKCVWLQQSFVIIIGHQARY